MGGHAGRLRAALAAAGLVAAALAVGAATGGNAAKPRTIGTRGSVLEISADGARVAIRAELSGKKKTCQTGAVWTPSTRSVVRIGGDSCFEEGSSRHDSLTLAGTRVAWVDYDYGNHAYCAGPFTATLAAPKPEAIPSDCDGTTADEYFSFAGDGNFLVMSSWLLCEVDAVCADEQGNPLPAGVYDVTVSRLSGARPVSILPPTKNRELLDANRGHVLVWEPPGNVVVYSGKGKKLASFAANGGVDAGSLDGDTVVFTRGASLTIGAIANGSVRQRTLARGGKLRDLDGGILVYTAGRTIHLLRLADGNDRTYATVKGLVDAQLEPPGLFYAANSGGGPKPGRVTFVPRSRL